MKPTRCFSPVFLSCLAVALNTASCSEEKKPIAAPVESKVVEERLVFEGDAVIEGEDDLVKMARYSEITGKLVVKRSRVPTLALPKLEVLGGKLSIRKNQYLNLILLPRLTSVGSAGTDDITIESNGDLRRVDLGGLKTVTSGVALRNNPVLEDLTLASLVAVAGNGLEISGAGALVGLTLPVLRTVDYFTVEGCEKLESLEMEDLELVVHVDVRNNSSLEKIHMPNLVSIYSDHSKNAVKSGLYLVGNTSLSSLEGLSRLEMIGRNGPLEVTGNTSLPGCTVNALEKKLSGKGWKGSARLCDNYIDECSKERCSAATGK